MAEQGDKTWILILQKSPRGPFTETEVRELLENGVVNLNSFALEVSKSNPKARSEWKFLWQFHEFERREETTSIPPEQERRVPVDTEKKKIDVTKIKSTPRIGVDYAGEEWAGKEYRFVLEEKLFRSLFKIWLSKITS